MRSSEAGQGQPGTLIVLCLPIGESVVRTGALVLTRGITRGHAVCIEIHYTDSIQTRPGGREAQADKENDPSPTDHHQRVTTDLGLEFKDGRPPRVTLGAERKSSR